MKKDKDTSVDVIYFVLIIFAILATPLLFGLYVLLNPANDLETNLYAFLSNLSATMVATLVVFIFSILVFRRVSNLEKERAEKHLAEAISAGLEDIVAGERRISQAGIARTYSGLPVELLQNRVSSADTRVNIVQIWINDPKKRFEEAFKAVGKSLTIRILEANPASALVKLRAESQRHLFPATATFDPEFIAKALSDNLEVYKQLVRDHDIKLEVRWYDGVPPFTMHIIDDTALIGFYAYGGFSHLTPHLEVRSGENDLTTFEEFCSTQFDALWETAEVKI